MDHSKPIATLSSALLARKGGAKPATKTELDVLADSRYADLGHAAEVVPISRAADALVNDARRQQDQLSDVFLESSSRHRISALSRGGKAAFTLRLDEDRHLRLRLASTASGRSAQQVVTEALDNFLASLPEIDAIAGQIRRKRTN
jgi:predicted HicB family RNase H-like nuclease